jgi:hypothetical protein
MLKVAAKPNFFKVFTIFTSPQLIKNILYKKNYFHIARSGYYNSTPPLNKQKTFLTSSQSILLYLLVFFIQRNNEGVEKSYHNNHCGAFAPIAGTLIY